MLDHWESGENDNKRVGWVVVDKRGAQWVHDQLQKAQKDRIYKNCSQLIILLLISFLILLRYFSNPPPPRCRSSPPIAWKRLPQTRPFNILVFQFHWLSSYKSNNVYPQHQYSIQLSPTKSRYYPQEFFWTFSLRPCRRWLPCPQSTGRCTVPGNCSFNIFRRVKYSFYYNYCYFCKARADAL